MKQYTEPTDVFAIREGEWQIKIGCEVLPHIWNSKGAALAGLAVECRRRGVQELPAAQIIVAGHGDFPRGMLRYDGLAPATPEDARSIDLDTTDLRAHESRRVVRLASVRSTSAPAPTRARWESFGWTVVSHDHYGIRRPAAEIAELCAALGPL